MKRKRETKCVNTRQHSDSSISLIPAGRSATNLLLLQTLHCSGKQRLDPERYFAMRTTLLLTFLLASSVVMAGRISTYYTGLNNDVEKDTANDIEKRDTQVRDVTGNRENSDILDDLESPFDQGRID